MIHHTAIVDLTAKLDYSVKVGEFVIIRPNVVLNSGVVVKARATIGEGVHVGEDTFIGPHSCICVWDTDGSHKPGLIGKDVYIGTGAIILPGVKIGDHVTIAAGSVVTRHCLEPGIYMGSPCRKA
ncbi:MAG: DapH/DapD/GlmU-related protein [Planctomycetota bacterium]|jgi:acetyltransferase-like isoleucine patch superfamily enzyme